MTSERSGWLQELAAEAEKNLRAQPKEHWSPATKALFGVHTEPCPTCGHEREVYPE